MNFQFTKLSESYPIDAKGQAVKIEGKCVSYENQCAVRLSRAIYKATNINIFDGTNYTKKLGPVCTADGITHARGAEELFKHLKKYLGPPKKLSPKSRKGIAGRKGIVFFKDIKHFRGGRGDHIDLWDGSATKTGEYFSEAKEVWFWDIKN